MIPKLMHRRILVVEDVQETRDSIKALLTRDGYHVDSSRDEEEALEKIVRQRPDLILISLGGTLEQIVSISQRIRLRGRLGKETPVVIFSLASTQEGAEDELGGNIYVTAPDNFNQLRALLTRVVSGTLRAQ
jgi:CheY-like chemotaxis protein